MSEVSGNSMDGAEEVDEFERALAKAMQRVDAPEGFAERVMARAIPSHVSEARRGAHGVLVMPRLAVHSRAWVGGAIAAVLVLGAFGAEQVHVRRKREKAEMATRQFEAAVLVTDQALQQTRAQLARAGLKLGD